MYVCVYTCACVQIGVLHGAVEHVDTSQKLKTSHEHSLCTALYNKNFKLVSWAEPGSLASLARVLSPIWGLEG